MVEMKPLDEKINEESIDLMKIDVEGAEDLVLEGARNCLKRTKMVIIEYDKLSIFNVYKILKEEGFTYKKFWITIFFLLKVYNDPSLLILAKMLRNP
jgi:hypothetical protein